jgi:hypothetical protein
MRIALLLAAAAAVLVTGCGSETQGGASEPPASSDPTGAGGVTELTVAVQAGLGSGEQEYTLTCDPPGGDHPDPDAACRALAAMDDPFAPVPKDQACTDIYGGPQTATVAGTYRGAEVRARFERTDGCQIARWDAYVDLLVERGGAEGS